MFRSTRSIAGITRWALTPWLLLALLLSACQPIQAPTPATGAAQAMAYTPRFEPADCPYEVAAGDPVECGYLVVPEDRSQPDGPTIRVLVINFKAKDATPAPDPVILVPGGPGFSTLAYFWFMNDLPLGQALRSQHDTLLIEHRGSNRSEPAFYCPEMEADLAGLAGLSLAGELEQSQLAYRACHERLVQEGHNLSMYGPVEIAADVADLRLALGYEEVNVLSLSYGTLVTAYLLRDHPQGIRSAVLDGVSPPEIFQGGEYLKMTQGWLDALFQACTEDATCQAAYPDVETVFYDTLEDLRAQPVAVTVADASGANHEVLIDDIIYANYVLSIGFLGDTFTAIPAAIMTVHNQDYAAVAQGWLGFLAGRHGENTPGSWAWSMGMAVTATCLQENTVGSLAVAEAQHAQVESVPSLRDWALLITQDWMLPCEYWNVTPASDAAIGQPVSSDVPTLMLVSTFDAATAPYFSDAQSARFRHGYRIELPLSHLTTLTACGAELLAQFLADPNQTPDARCVEEMTANWVVPETSGQ